MTAIIDASILYRHAAASDYVGRAIYLYREDLYWLRSRGEQYWSHRPPVPRHDVRASHGGSKIRMLDGIAFTRGPVVTQGTPHSNQIRQVAAYMAEAGFSSPLYVLVKPDHGTVGWDVLNEGNLALARRLYPNTNVILMLSSDMQEEHQAELTRLSQMTDVTMIPRGVSSATSVMATACIGRDVLEAMGTGAVPSNARTVCVVGSGTTYAGISRAYVAGGLEPPLGLLTRPRLAEVLRHLEAISPGIDSHLSRFYLDDSYATASGIGDASAVKWSKWRLLLGLNLDRTYCGRMIQYLEDVRASPTREERDPRPLVLIVTGLEQEAD